MMYTECVLYSIVVSIRNGFLLSHLIFTASKQKKNLVVIVMYLQEYNKKNICYNKQKIPPTFIINDRKSIPIWNKLPNMSELFCFIFIFLVMKSNTLPKHNTLNLYVIKNIYIYVTHFLMNVLMGNWQVFFSFFVYIFFDSSLR